MNAKKIKGFLRLAAPTICTCLAAVGVTVTSVLSAKGALKAESVLRDKELTAKEKAKAAAPSFIPAAVMGTITTGLIFAANILGRKQQTALIAGSASMYKALQERAVKSEKGDDKPSTNGLLTFYDPLSMRYFDRTMEDVLTAEYHLNRNFTLRGYSPLNEFYQFLNLDETPDGDKYGWEQCVGIEVYGYQWIDFWHHFVKAGEPISEWNRTVVDRDCWVIEIEYGPTDDYLTYEG